MAASSQLIYDYEITVQPAFHGDAVIVRCLHCDEYKSAMWKGTGSAEDALHDFLIHFQAKHRK